MLDSLLVCILLNSFAFSSLDEHVRFDFGEEVAHRLGREYCKRRNVDRVPRIFCKLVLSRLIKLL